MKENDLLMCNMMNDINPKTNSPTRLNKNVRILNMMEDYLSNCNDKRKKVKQMKRRLEDLCHIQKQAIENNILVK